MSRPPYVAPYLDGIRGTAAFLVFVHHFLLAFYPSYFSFDMATTHNGGLDVWFGRSVFSVLSNGNFCVHIFFVLSGFVLSRKYYHTGDMAVPVSAMYRRFIRLYIPVAFALISAYVLIVLGAFRNAEVSQISHSDWWFGGMWRIVNAGETLLRCLLYETMFNGNNVLVTSVWTISQELYGSMLVFAFLVFAHFSRYRIPLLLVMLAYFYFTRSFGYFCFMAGVSLCHTERRSTGRYDGVIALLSLAAALVLGSFPSNGNYEHTLFADLGHTLMAFRDWFHSLGAYLLVLAFVLSPSLQRLASLSLFRFLGYISFAFYLLHVLLMGTFSSALFLNAYPLLGYHWAVVVVFLVTVPTISAFSWLATRFIDEPGIAFAHKLADKFLRPVLDGRKKECTTV